VVDHFKDVLDSVAAHGDFIRQCIDDKDKDKAITSITALENLMRGTKSSSFIKIRQEDLAAALEKTREARLWLSYGHAKVRGPEALKALSMAAFLMKDSLESEKRHAAA